MDELERKYQAMCADIRSKGLFDRRYDYYAAYCFVNCVLLAISLYLVTVSTNAWFQIANSVLFTLATVQFGMLGHDLSHGQVFSSASKNRGWGIIMWAVFGGLSEGVWFRRHNAHHENVNKVDHDPDINIPFLFAGNQTSGSFAAPSALLRYQHILFFVSLPFWYMSRIINTWYVMVTSINSRYALEIVLAGLHFVVLIAFLLAFLPLSVTILFLSVHILLVGLYMACVFAPNHKGEEISDADEEITWKHQITSTRNIYPSHTVFHFMGGLNFQVEHHLFPNMPRINYWKAQPIVKQFCLDNNIEYHETTWFGSMKEIYVSLKSEAERDRSLSHQTKSIK